MTTIMLFQCEFKVNNMSCHHKDACHRSHLNPFSGESSIDRDDAPLTIHHLAMRRHHPNKI
jgi:hypothetical protein